MQLLKRLFKKEVFNPFKDAKWKIIPAFESGGIQYYQFDDPFNIPAERGQLSLDYYREYEMRVSLKELNSWLDEMDAIQNPLPGRPLRIGDAALITKVLRQKTQFLFEPDLLWKIGSVVYFDDTESPGRVDDSYANQKVARWKKDMSIDVFFSLSRMYKWIPSLGTSAENIQTYSKVVESAKKEHSEILSLISSRRNAMPATVKN